MFALFINAAILIVAAATFYSRGRNDVAEIQDAYKLLSPVLGVTGASSSLRWRCSLQARIPLLRERWPVRS